MNKNNRNMVMVLVVGILKVVILIPVVIVCAILVLGGNSSLGDDMFDWYLNF